MGDKRLLVSVSGQAKELSDTLLIHILARLFRLLLDLVGLVEFRVVDVGVSLVIPEHCGQISAFRNN